jgi:nucleotide-binding universal stress UspA family protein
VLPLDLTKETREKINKSIEIAKLFGSTIHLVTVLTTDDEFIVKKLQRQMKQVHDHIAENEVSCTSEFLNNDNVAQSVVDYAKKINADLLMIMTQEETNWTDIMFISSSAQVVINNSEIPVLSIRPKERKDTTVSVFQY